MPPVEKDMHAQVTMFCQCIPRVSFHWLILCHPFQTAHSVISIPPTIDHTTPPPNAPTFNFHWISAISTKLDDALQAFCDIE
jgi:hypothetical protein